MFSKCVVISFIQAYDIQVIWFFFSLFSFYLFFFRYYISFIESSHVCLTLMRPTLSLQASRNIFESTIFLFLFLFTYLWKRNCREMQIHYHFAQGTTIKPNDIGKLHQDQVEFFTQIKCVKCNELVTVLFSLKFLWKSRKFEKDVIKNVVRGCL